MAFLGQNSAKHLAKDGIVLYDQNGISIDGPLSLADSVDQVQRFAAAGWAASRINGHDSEAIVRAIHVENAEPVEYGQLLFELEPVTGPPAV